MLDTSDTLSMMDALAAGEDAVRAIAEGAPPPVETLQDLADLLDAIRVGVANGTLATNLTVPTEADVEAARELTRRAREGAPPTELRELAHRVEQALEGPGTRPS